MDDYGRTPIFHSIVKGDMHSFKQEFAIIPDINISDVNGMNLLFFACIYNQLEMAELLIKNGIDIEKRDKYGNTPLWRATFECKGSKYALVELLVKHGANVYSLNNAGRSPLIFAQTVGDARLITLLESSEARQF